jgi:hypothetical protein
MQFSAANFIKAQNWQSCWIYSFCRLYQNDHESNKITVSHHQKTIFSSSISKKLPKKSWDRLSESPSGNRIVHKFFNSANQIEKIEVRRIKKTCIRKQKKKSLIHKFNSMTPSTKHYRIIDIFHSKTLTTKHLPFLHWRF